MIVCERVDVSVGTLAEIAEPRTAGEEDLFAENALGSSGAPGEIDAPDMPARKRADEKIAASRSVALILDKAHPGGCDRRRPLEEGRLHPARRR